VWNGGLTILELELLLLAQMFPYTLVAAPFFFVGSVLWVVAPIIGLQGLQWERIALQVAVAAAACFLVDCNLLLLADDGQRPLLNFSHSVYLYASTADLVASTLDLVTLRGNWYVSNAASMFYLIAGAVALMDAVPRGAKLEMVRSR
jgi:hypothetical protein